ncbi:hypothetical protein B0H11DRAFT_1932807 [Mycena galericulata]|nr:hypothetical protein B0H11DRAFT_1932807 [Mycena galericulata]
MSANLGINSLEAPSFDQVRKALSAQRCVALNDAVNKEKDKEQQKMLPGAGGMGGLSRTCHCGTHARAQKGGVHSCAWRDYADAPLRHDICICYKHTTSEGPVASLRHRVPSHDARSGAVVAGGDHRCARVRSADEGVGCIAGGGQGKQGPHALPIVRKLRGCRELCVAPRSGARTQPDAWYRDGDTFNDWNLASTVGACCGDQELQVMRAARSEKERGKGRG